MGSANTKDGGGTSDVASDRELRTLAAKIIGQLPEDPEKARRVIHYTVMFLNDFIDANCEEGSQFAPSAPLQLVRRDEGGKSP